MERDRKEYRRNNYKQKSFKKNNRDVDVDRKDQHKIQKAFKQKKKIIQEEESWDQWEDEIY